MSDTISGSSQATSWRLNTPDVSSELIGNEVVAIHLPTGTYYSIENAASLVWTGIEQGLNFEQLVQGMVAAYDVSPAQAKSDTATFLSELSQEKLIVEAPASGATPEPAPARRQPYTTPKLEKFSDLECLLMIDPIHEVDQRGWPHARP